MRTMRMRTMHMRHATCDMHMHMHVHMHMHMHTHMHMHLLVRENVDSVFCSYWGGNVFSVVQIELNMDVSM